MGGNVLDFLEFNKLLKKDELNYIYLFKGTEEYLMDKYVETIKDKYIDENFRMINYIEIDINGTFDDILNACETLPFMSEKKVVVIKDINELIQQDKSISDKINDYLLEVPENIILLIVDKTDKLKKTTKIYKNINKNRGVIEFNRLDNRQLENFIKTVIERNGSKIGTEEVEYFIEKSGYITYKSEKTLFELENELVKVANHSEDIDITKGDIDANILEDLDTSIFSFIDGLMNRDSRKALVIFNNMYKQGEPVPKILFMLIRNYRLMIKFMTYNNMGYRRNDINAKLGISSYELKKIDSNSRKFTLEYIEKVLKELLDFDTKQKTVYIDEKLLMENLIVKITKLM